MNTDLDFLEENGDTAEWDNIRAGVAALRGDRKELFSALSTSLGKTIFPRNVRQFPVFEDYWDDAEFMKLFSSEDN